MDHVYTTQERREMNTEFQWENLEVIDLFNDLGFDGRVV